MQLNPYLYFNDRCEEAFTFYEKVLGGKIVAMVLRRLNGATKSCMPASS